MITVSVEIAMIESPAASRRRFYPMMLTGLAFDRKHRDDAAIAAS
jgi:hypothetical protein